MVHPVTCAIIAIVVIVLKDCAALHDIRTIHIDQGAVPDFAGIVEITIQYCAAIKDDILRGQTAALYCKQDGIGIHSVAFSCKTFSPADRYRISGLLTP